MTPRKIKIDIQKSTAQQLVSIVKASRDVMRKDKGLNGDLDRLPMLTWIMFLKFLDDLEEIRKEEANLAGKKFRQAIEPPYRWRDWASKPGGDPRKGKLIATVGRSPTDSTARRTSSDWCRSECVPRQLLGTSRTFSRRLTASAKQLSFA